MFDDWFPDSILMISYIGVEYIMIVNESVKEHLAIQMYKLCEIDERSGQALVYSSIF